VFASSSEAISVSSLESLHRLFSSDGESDSTLSFVLALFGERESALM
jgi:hypothetical protein